MSTFDRIVKKAREQESYWIESAMYEFTEKICELMESNDMSRTQLALELGVSPAYITKLLRGDANVTIKTMVRLARVFGRELRITLPQETVEHSKVTFTTGRAA